ncbi:MAG: carbamoyltransferase HypF [Mycobacteriales bacterium]
MRAAAFEGYTRSLTTVNGGDMTLTGTAQRIQVRVSGVVQGVGFRPFVWKAATDLGLSGWVHNDAEGVLLEVEGPPSGLDDLVRALVERPPPLARVDSVRALPVATTGERGFAVRDSHLEGPRVALVAADAATCPACLGELADPADRRYRYPFVNCTHCGPRYTIVRSVPYDRARTTMAGFALCPDCRREYDDPADRRFHAQPVCCPACGPQLSMPVTEAADRLHAGQVLAVKGLGGLHLAVLASDEDAVARLRARKHREERPFALMVRDLAAALALCEVEPAEEALLTSAARPIVLLRRRGSGVAPSVAPHQRFLGIMLPYTPLHHLLLEAVDAPLVMTSGNRSDEPIVFRDEDAHERLDGIADAFLTHDRPIETRVDDSVLRVVRGRPVPIRRSRGYVPGAVALPWRLRRHVLACGGELKSTFALGRDEHAFVSHHIGDLDSWTTFQAYLHGITHLQRLLDVRPELVAHDLHPDYASSRYAQELDGVELVGVQHHHAHIASCLVDNGREGPVIGVAFDGTGLGADGTVWGGELLLADLRTAERAGHLRPVPLPGGDRAVREPWRMAAAYLQEAYGETPPDLPLRHRHPRWQHVLAAAGAGVNAPPTSSAGRLFDAVAAVLGVRDVASYEGQAAIELEQLAEPGAGAYPVVLDGAVLDGVVLFRHCVEDLLAGTPVPVVSARFHDTLAATVAHACELLRERSGLGTVALSGGVWQNALLLSRALELLEDKGFEVLTHRQVPCNDGGLSLGQLAVAGALDRGSG